MKPKWRSFNGEIKSMDNVDQQHLSNIYWFNTIINGRDKNWSKRILDELQERFNGEIWYDGEIVGYIETSEYIRDKKLEKILE